MLSLNYIKSAKLKEPNRLTNIVVYEAVQCQFLNKNEGHLLMKLFNQVLA